MFGILIWDLNESKAMSHFPTETMEALVEMAKEYKAKQNTIVLSNASDSAKREVLEMLQLREQGSSWLCKPENIQKMPAFEWLQGDEDAKQNRDAYMKHLLHNVKLPANYSMADVQPNRTSLSVDLPGKEKRRKICGTTHVVVAQKQNIKNEALRQNIEVLLELKKPNNMAGKGKNHDPQAVCEHLAASFLNKSTAVVTVLTDLNDSWTFYWFARDPDCNGAVSLQKLKLTADDLSADLAKADLAKYILENLFVRANKATLPSTLVDRLPFDAVVQAMTPNPAAVARAENSQGDEDSNDGPSSEFHDQEDQDGSSRKPPSANGKDRRSDIAKEESQNRSGHVDTTQTRMGAAQFLSLFAPPSSRDVANELDLLDMIDEAEQYEIIRSFAAKHIVPSMMGVGLVQRE